MNFAKIVKELRYESRLSQMELSKKLGITAAAIGHLELGKREPGSHTLIVYSKYFGVTTDYLLGLEDDFGNVIIEKEAPQLSAEELQIIENYRALNPSGKKLVKQTIDTLNSSSSSSSAKKYS